MTERDMRVEPVGIRPAFADESSVLLDLFNSSRAGVGCYSGQEVDFATFTASIEGEEVHVAVLGEMVVGFISVWAADRFIHHLYVSPDHQSCGVGTALLDACRNIYGLPLTLKCDACNHKARRFYRNKGWQPKETGFSEHGPWEQYHSPHA